MGMMMRAAAVGVMTALLAVPAAGQSAAVRLDVPLVKQPYNLCLAASVSMVLRYWGIDVAPKTIGAQVAVYKDGTTGQDLVRFVEKFGLRGFLVQPPFEDLLVHLQKHRPLIVVLPAGKDRRHAVVLTGFDPVAEVVWVNNPALGEPRAIPYARFRAEWDAAHRWTLLIAPQ